MPEPAFNLAKFNRQLEFQIEKKVNERTLEKVRLSAQFAYEYIVDNWPVDTYWSLANNRISITGRDIVKLEPRTRPDESGVLEGKARVENQKELDKLDRLTTDRRQYNVVIGNAVPYAPDVPYKNIKAGNGGGRMLYQDAQAAAKLADFAFKF